MERTSQRKRLARREPGVVYHYTSMDTMIKIARSESIWATSINYLNDVSEGDHFLQLVRERIPIYQQAHPLEDESIFDDFLDGSHQQFEDRPFVASFSEEGDSLPQWRSYCPQGNGVAIGFKVDCLRRSYLRSDAPVPVLPHIIKPSLSFRKVDYLSASDNQSLDREISTAIGLAFRNEDEDKKELLPISAGYHFKSSIESIAGFKKHPSFVNEHEYRLLVDGIYWDKSYLDFRSTRSTLVPYIPVLIPRLESGHDNETKPLIALGKYRWEFIDRVVIGPTANTVLSCEAVSAFFKKMRMDVEVVASTVPYRDW